MSAITHQFDPVKAMANFLARKSPEHPVWEGSEFDMCDACTCLLMQPGGPVLIYVHGRNGDAENVILPPVVLKMLVEKYRDTKWEF